VRPTLLRPALLVLLALIGGGCAGGGAAEKASPTTEVPLPVAAGPVPGLEWEAADPVAAGFDAAALAELVAEAEAAGSNCLLVSRGGRIVGEWYWNGTDPGTTQEVFSASKSVTSTLVGLAAADGALRVDQPASTWITEWADTPSAEVTVEDLLSNDSGRQYDARTDYGDMAVRAPDKTAFSIALGQDAEPGAVWQYNNSAIQTLEAVLERSTGTDMADFAEQRLFGPIGMTASGIKRDAAGNPLAFMGVETNCRDLARFGTLALRDGNWGGEQVVPAAWFEAATGAPSQELNSAYGYLWWLNHPGRIAGAGQAVGAAGDGAGGEGATDGAAEGEAAETRRQLVPGAPEDMFWALGLGGQVVQVDPGSDTVVVRLGSAGAPGRFGPSRTAEFVTRALSPGTPAGPPSG
jgi:CubicO group peptidase (beta-lactamase class C family)